MKKITYLAVYSLIVLLVACSSGNTNVQKVVIMANGKMQIDPETRKIKLDPGNTHTEEILAFTGSKKSALQVETPAGTKTYDMNEDGLYVLNLKVDTLVGGVVNYSSGGRAASISGEQLEHMIDSTRQLIEGKNVSDEKKTFFIVPGSIKKVSNNLDVNIIGPYKGIPYKVEADKSGKPIEVYKFFTNKQKRETLDDMMKRFGW